MTIRDWLPQTILVFFILISNVSIMKGADKKAFNTTIFGTIGLIGLLWWGKFFG